MGAGEEDLSQALQPGGLANVKAKVIKRILDEVYERNGGKDLSLDDLHGATDEDAMRTLVSFGGVGPKTGAYLRMTHWHLTPDVEAQSQPPASSSSACLASSLPSVSQPLARSPRGAECAAHRSTRMSGASQRRDCPAEALAPI
jgi:hypothetical protein